MTIPEKAAKYCKDIANDNKHGYSQYHRWGPDYDCSSLVISAYEDAGVPVKSMYGATYTGNMRKAFIKAGFKIMPYGTTPQVGDVFLREGYHTYMYIGNGNIAEASIDERGGIAGRTKGDQTGKEIRIKCYRPNTRYMHLRYGVVVTTSIVVKKGTWWVREGNSTKYKAIGIARGGEDYKYTEKKGNWYYLPAFKGWISGKGVERRITNVQ